MQNHNGALLRGDPRMNRAVQLKLQDPGLSLETCLRLGGFCYPPKAAASTVDPEMITFRQRKNQLSRRVKQAKQLPIERDIFQEVPDRTGTNASANINAFKKKSGIVSNTGSCTSTADTPMASGASARKTDQRSRENVSLALEPDLINAEYFDTKTSSQGNGFSIYPINSIHMEGGTIPELQIRYPRPAEGGVKMGWNQDHGREVVLKACQQTKAAQKQTAETNKKDTSLSPCDSNQHEAGSTRRERDRIHPGDQRHSCDQKIGVALDVFAKEMRAFTYQKAMIMAGYSMEECKVSSKTFQQFAFYAWTKETERLSGLREK